MKPSVPLLSLGILLLTAFAGCTGVPAETTATPAPTNGTTAPTTGAAVSNPYALPSKSTSVVGSGATFPKPLLETWGIEFARQHSTVQVSYAGGGSGKGITDITNKDVLFAGSDAPMTVAEKGKASTVLHIPETLGLVAVVYKVSEIPTGLKLTGDLIGKIYLGIITNWNDARIAALNPGVTLPDRGISIVYRSDSSGTTFVFTDFLTRTSPDWQSTMGTTPSKKPDWTKSKVAANAQQGGPGNDGVGSAVRGTEGSIGYVELAYVNSLKLKASQVQNKAGEYVTPTTQGASIAASSAAPDLPNASGDWSQVSISNAVGSGSYPISSFTYILVHASLSDYGGKYSADQLNAFRAWLYWGLHDGQALSEPLGYAPLPSAVVALGEGALASMNV